MKKRFRAWDKVEQKMGDVLKMDFEEWWLETTTGSERHSFDAAETDRFILMEALPLLDHDGARVYEGDIVTLFSGEYAFGCWEFSITGDIVRQGFGFALMDDTLHTQDLMEILSYGAEVHVVGNIYDKKL